MELSNETLTVFKIIYCEYKRRRSVGFTKPDSIKFKDGEIYQIAAFKNRLRPDIDYAVHELATVKYLKKIFWEIFSLQRQALLICRANLVNSLKTFPNYLTLPVFLSDAFDPWRTKGQFRLYVPRSRSSPLLE